MTEIDRPALEAALAALPDLFTGPGGVAGVVFEGQVIAAHAWGYADLARRLPMSATLRLPICSITKQFTCGLFLELPGDRARQQAVIDGYLPNLTGPRPTLEHLCHNQSGLRDYWAMTVLQGAQTEDVFGPEMSLPALAETRSTHFTPGSHYSYSNGNFRLLGEMLEETTGRSLDELLSARLFAPAGMETAGLNADTSHPADGVVGYEGSAALGYFPARNRIYWTGDAGMAASLHDMLAWERWIDQSRDAADGLYARMSAPQQFSDGRPARYGYGLRHDQIAGLRVTGHGGALRGFRAQRFHAAAARLSVVVLFNHEASAYSAAESLMRAALGQSAPPPGEVPGPEWAGSYWDAETGLLLRVAPQGHGVQARYGTVPDQMRLESETLAVSAEMTLERGQGGMMLRRPGDNLAGLVPRVTGPAQTDIAGLYACGEITGEMEITERGGVFYAGFKGLLGQGAMERLTPVAADLWVMACRRTLDAPAPGDWTLRFHRDASGAIAGLTIGCWLARKVPYRRVG
ncbi:D-aminopeptidase [Phaeovulum sp. W22_SRMD_FR3]|uniref:D-aminopeptidase n=1 Tax=Phaeovulum sp. W22_SRMD_FR3 TaxID=3240274 RepID=UPI003F9C68F3